MRDTALAGSDNSGPFHCLNTPGTYAHHEGVAGLREQYVGHDWDLCRSDGIEGIRHKETGTKIGFQNVDIAHDLNHAPKPRSEKGVGAERAAEANLFGTLPRHYKPLNDMRGAPLYYLMVDKSGACELSRPIIENKTFKDFIERIFLDDGSGGDKEEFSISDDGGTLTDFDVPVSKKG